MTVEQVLDSYLEGKGLSRSDQNLYRFDVKNVLEMDYEEAFAWVARGRQRR